MFCLLGFFSSGTSLFSPQIVVRMRKRKFIFGFSKNSTHRVRKCVSETGYKNA